MKKSCKKICINVLWRMKEITSIDKDYRDWVSELKGRFRQSQIKAAVRVNSEMLRFYWSLGQDIVERQMENIYGSGFFSRLSKDLQQELPDTKGFSPTNIKYFKYFYELYSTLFENRPQVADDLFHIPWDHHRRIIDRCKGDPQKALFYVRKTRENSWSRAVLRNFLDSDIYDREGKAMTNFKTALPVLNGDLAQQMTKIHIVSIFLRSRNNIPKKNSRMRLWIIFRGFCLNWVTDLLLWVERFVLWSVIRRNL